MACLPFPLNLLCGALYIATPLPVLVTLLAPDTPSLLMSLVIFYSVPLVSISIYAFCLPGDDLFCLWACLTQALNICVLSSKDGNCSITPFLWSYLATYFVYYKAFKMAGIKNGVLGSLDHTAYPVLEGRL